MTLLDYPAKICWTAAGVLIHEDKVLLIKHTKLGIWLNPGGHLEGSEAPHQAAQREFWEETGIRVKARFLHPELKAGQQVQVLPSPFSTNLHWVCEENYNKRQADPEHYQLDPKWKRGCEQHLNFIYLLELVGQAKVVQNHAETTDVRWFSLAEIKNNKEILPDIKSEIELAFSITRSL